MHANRVISRVALCVAFALAGCATVEHANHTEATAQQQAAMIQSNIDQARKVTQYGDVVKYLDQQYVSLTPVTRASEFGGAKNQLKCRIEIATDQPISLLEAAQVVSRDCKVPVRVTQDAIQQMAGYGQVNSNAQMQTAGMATPGGAPVVGAIGGAASFGQPTAFNAMLPRGRGNEPLIDVNYSGTGDGFMDMICARAGGLSWRKDDSGTFRIFAIDTQMFSISSLASDESTMSSSFQSGTTMVNGATGAAGSSTSNGSSGQGTSSTMQATAVKLKADLWTDIQSALDTLAGKGNAIVSRATSSVTVRGPVDVLNGTKEYIDFQNKRLSKAVRFDVSIYSVTNTNNDSAGINWNAVYGTVTGKFGMTLAGSAFAAPSAAVNAGFSVLKSSGSPWSGTQAIISALNEQGTTRLERTQVLPTLNFQPVATQIGTQRGYVAGIQTTQTAQVGSSTSIQMGTINVGFSLSLFPYVQDNNDILAHFNLNLSNLDGIRVISQNGTQVEAPNISLPLNTVQKVRISPGDTLVLTGLNQTDDSSTRNGTGVAWNWIFGGGVDAQKTRSSLVVLITPVLMD
ncbi:PilN family type IVB pilus formation outer membrane protein [Ralstonia sp. ASV6]|uniref:PilN family type IVB pilus formation outer membrane protein n=1 Tax=Ralstonia sp. ASV6 TaxID=2795124 RepID=UPI0018EB226C|nr:PilN family type IVB pilus formation outer membrane protein [Ralstonia sp. ASV6]